MKISFYFILKQTYYRIEADTRTLSQMELFSTIANSWEPLAIVAINSALNVGGFLDLSLTMNNRITETFAVSLVKVLKRIP